MPCGCGIRILKTGLVAVELTPKEQLHGILLLENWWFNFVNRSAGYVFHCPS